MSGLACPESFGKVRVSVFGMACLLALAVPWSGGAQGAGAQMSQAEAVRLLASDDRRERDRGLDRAWDLWSQAGPELRAAVIRAAWREARADINSESTTRYARVAALFEDPAAIPLLVEVMHTSIATRLALANFGEAALPGVLEKAMDPGVATFPRPASGDPNDLAIQRGIAALHILRLMAERELVGPEELETMCKVARLRLEPPVHFEVELLAKDLAGETCRDASGPHRVVLRKQHL